MIPAFLQDWAVNLEQAQRDAKLAKRGGLWRPASTPSTDLGYRCDRRIVLHQVKPEDAAEIGAELASIFEEGKLHERAVRAELSELGFEVVEAETNYRDDSLRISGTIDGKVEVPFPRDQEERLRRMGAQIRFGKLRIPVEIKSTMGRAPRDQQEWQHHPTAMFRRWYVQLQSYLILDSQPFGCGLFKSKTTGLWTVVPVEMNWEDNEAFLARAERVRDAVDAYRADPGDHSLPEHIRDRSECGACPWRDRACFPDQVDIDPMAMIQDRELLAQLRARHDLERAQRDFKRLDTDIKSRLKHTKGDEWVVGTATQGFHIGRKIDSRGAHRITIKPLAAQADDGKE